LKYELARTLVTQNETYTAWIEDSPTIQPSSLLLKGAGAAGCWLLQVLVLLNFLGYSDNLATSNSEEAESGRHQTWKQIRPMVLSVWNEFASGYFGERLTFFVDGVLSCFFYETEREFLLYRFVCAPFVFMWVEKALSVPQLSKSPQLEVLCQCDRYAILSTVIYLRTSSYVERPIYAPSTPKTDQNHGEKGLPTILHNTATTRFMTIPTALIYISRPLGSHQYHICILNPEIDILLASRSQIHSR